MKLWSHEAAQRLVHEDSEDGRRAREILSNRYGNAAILILPLKDGSFAILGIDRQLLEVAEEAPSADTLRRLSTESEKRTRDAVKMLAREPNDREYARHLKGVRHAEDAPKAPRRETVVLDW